MCYLDVIESNTLTHFNAQEDFGGKSHIQDQKLIPENNGDLFDAVSKNMIDSEVLLRTYFHQFISQLEAIHSEGIAHLNLKLENLILSSDYKLEIINFENAQYIADEYMESRGSQGYRAQEVINEDCEDLEAADVYSAGVILYALKAKKFPFVEIDQGDSICVKDYAQFVKNNEGFWRSKNCLMGDEDYFGEEFKKLINGMLERNVTKRFSLEQIKQSQWYQGDILDSENLKNEMELKAEKAFEVLAEAEEDL